ncbi:MAG: flavodoxin-dependent (E)-4-hydroxy-3-methylbut-2-enyl-diphosphate synthase [Lentisphaerae bacterium]|jgi:(E)-4-hydroxy-3-methylbut-2-enyl-diphosphate synthase|nr:flavodoxin-dependent (E)-4-hydroxy-3-methylbut-2-enyl-diphosphate synthase [Lentisphaerota bacterium]MBT4820764.1 flavodoxin-dependent (E)-4-hydroxy-3-methylbut-2-enyl-diphosphate synthase [Lentisphaerota bacterium]MBT5611777.1 flavodoxin-dependent (E)-4-hydroxy-3-methylbut-2-enyl-diphosphate synthase [Lentisphaerota bacterium]MBT7057318.1 flavodoxin-dependent (E)-4-hydroxy-3-methylbut-2-enyl-diphosphate synthase [Lentisphaerota bacterium]MBT7841836.1 flavodoxin-dependent (E)-4-hydroxy-3-met
MSKFTGVPSPVPLHEQATPPSPWPRRLSRRVYLRETAIGGNAPITVQSMTTTPPHDARGTLEQIAELASAGCDIVRVTVPDALAVNALEKIVTESPIPVVADIHFESHLALDAIRVGAHGIRINPGNIGTPDAVREIAALAAEKHVVIRVGVNSGSLEPDLLARFGGPTPEAIVVSAKRHCQLLEDAGCARIKVSLKASDVRTTVAANRLFAAQTDYPLHLGVTEAGNAWRGSIKSAMGIGCLLLEGIGDTIRVSLTAPPSEEVRAALLLLSAIGLRTGGGPDVISCPTCGRTKVELAPLVEAVEAELAQLAKAGNTVHLERIAVMGCAVNGPGEAREADLGIALGKKSGVLFKKGIVVGSIPEGEITERLIQEIRSAAEPGSELKASPIA